MDRDEFMELVYETFADEPDNVLANGIIEAADAYVEHEKAQHSQEGTTKDTISRQQAIDALHMYLMYRMGTDSNKKRLDDWINGVSSAQPEIKECSMCPDCPDNCPLEVKHERR